LLLFYRMHRSSNAFSHRLDPLATFASGSFRATQITVAGHHQKGHRFDLFVFRP
jgi:hypothetical protein